MIFLDAGGRLPLSREYLGKLVRGAWVRWAKDQPNPKESWLVGYHDLPECDKEADRMIGEEVARATMLAIAAMNGSPVNDDSQAAAGATVFMANLVARVSTLRGDIQGLDTLEIVFTWEDGREEVRYRRPRGSQEANDLIADVTMLQARLPDTPYSWRFVKA